MMTAQQLKNSILQRAIEGKLVEQRPEEGTAKELLNLIDKCNVKISTLKEELDYSAMDFDIPASWEWVELNRILRFVDYRGKTPNKIDSGVFLITASNIKDGYMDYTRKEYISEQEYNTRLERGVTEEGDILFTTEAPMGNCALNELKKCSCGQRIITFKSYEKDTINMKSMMYFLLSPSFQRELLDNCTGTTAKGIKAAKLKHFKVPIPPLSEQHRIVAKIEELMPLVDQYDKAYSQLMELNEKFPQDMKKSILQYAIEGKLVEQRAEEGTAKELLKEIKLEKEKLVKEGKIKKSKPLPPITEDEIPFEIPESWEWCRLGNISNYAQPKTKIKPCDINENMWSLDLEDIEKDTGRVINKIYTADRSIKGEKVVFSKGNILYSKLRPYLKKILIATDNGITSPEIIPFNIYGEVSQHFFMWVLKSSYVDSVVNGASYGVKMPRVGTDTMRNLLVPLPPLSEQHRIVAKIEELMTLCDKLVALNEV